MKNSLFNLRGENKVPNLWRSVRGQVSISFKVKACKEARVVFAGTQNLLTRQAYELIIGGWDNTKSAIKASMDASDVLSEVSSPNILSCTQARWFWASWDTKMLRFGKGKYPKDDQLLNVKLEYLPDALGMNTAPDQSIAWEFTNARGEGTFSMLWVISCILYIIYIDIYPDYDVTLRTPQNDKSDMAWITAPKKFFPFRIMACSNAIISLTSKPQDVSDGFQIIIGTHGNTISSIFKNSIHEMVQVQDTPQILSCGVYQDFWIRWEGRKLMVGEGDLDSGMFMMWEDPEPLTLHAISLRSEDPDGPITWNFYDLATSCKCNNHYLR